MPVLVAETVYKIAYNIRRRLSIRRHVAPLAYMFRKVENLVR